MMNMDAAVVEEAVKNVKEPITVAMLDSGVDYSENIPIAGRVNLIPGEDEMSEMYEDGTGHGTAVASVMVFRKDIDNEQEEIESDSFEYEYYPDDEDATDNEDVPDDEDEADDENELFEDDLDESGEMNFDEDYDDETDLEDSDEDGDSIRLGDYVETHQADFKGINPNMELYSIKVLDDYNEAPMSRVIEGIELARENKIKILNLSFGTSQDDPKLHQVIKQAYKEGMLIIASTDNDGKLQYPAAYEEVIGVGSVDYTGTVEDICENDECIELIAPGEGILAVGAFGIEEEAAGTSMAAAEVSAIASILWQNSPEVSNQFIRELLRSGAYKENESVPGFGVVDCKKSLELMDSLRETFQEKEITEETEYSEATDDEKTDTDTIGQEEEIYVSANWGGKNHLNLLKDYNELSEKYLKLLKIGIRLQDGPLCNLNDKKKFPAWHGYYKFEGNEDCNYVAGYLYLSELAREINDGSALVLNEKERKYVVTSEVISGNAIFSNIMMEGMITFDGVSGPALLDKNKKIKGFDNLRKDEISPTWRNILKSELYNPQVPANSYVTNGGINLTPTPTVKSLIVYGMALHTMSDAFAHSSVSCTKKKGEDTWVWKNVGSAVALGTSDEDITLKKLEKYNDNTQVRHMRYELAKQAVLNSLDHLKIEFKENATLVIKPTSVQDYCSRNYVGTDKIIYKEMKGISAYIHKNYIDPEYFEENFALRNICDYVSGCAVKTISNNDSKERKAYKYLKRLDIKNLKEKMKPYCAFNIKNLTSPDDDIKVGATVIVSVKKSVNKNDKGKFILKAKGKYGKRLCLALKKLKRNSEEKYYFSYTAFGEITEEIVDCDTPIISVSDTEDTVELVDRVEPRNTKQKYEYITIAGKIIAYSNEEKKETVSGASIVLSNKQVKISQLSNERGEYSIEKCSPGIYTLSVEKNGYLSYEQIVYITGYSEIYNNPIIYLLPESYSQKEGQVKGKIYDATTGEGTQGIVLKFRKGFNRYWGEEETVVEQTESNTDGSYITSEDAKLMAGYYCVEVIDPTSQYIDTFVNVIVVSGIPIEQDVYLSDYKCMEDSTMRIVLSWGNNPSDLDAHIIMDFDSKLRHVYFGNKKEVVTRYENGKQIDRTIIKLDRDDVDSYGPETITVDLDLVDMKFEYYVNNYSHGSDDELSKSKAMVQIYKGQYLVSTIKIPDKQTGYKWNVFDYDGENINIVNKVI